MNPPIILVPGGADATYRVTLTLEMRRPAFSVSISARLSAGLLTLLAGCSPPAILSDEPYDRAKSELVEYLRVPLEEVLGEGSLPEPEFAQALCFNESLEATGMVFPVAQFVVQIDELGEESDKLIPSVMRYWKSRGFEELPPEEQIDGSVEVGAMLARSDETGDHGGFAVLVTLHHDSGIAVVGGNGPCTTPKRRGSPDPSL